MQVGTVYLYIILMALWLKWMTLLAWTEMLMVPALRTQPFFVLNNVTISDPSRSFVGIGQIKHTLSHHAPTRAHFTADQATLCARLLPTGFFRLISFALCVINTLNTQSKTSYIQFQA